MWSMNKKKPMKTILTFLLIGLMSVSCSAQPPTPPEKIVEQRLVEYIATWERKEKEAIAGQDNCERERANSKAAAARYFLSTLRTEFKLPKP